MFDRMVDVKYLDEKREVVLVDRMKPFMYSTVSDFFLYLLSNLARSNLLNFPYRSDNRLNWKLSTPSPLRRAKRPQPVSTLLPLPRIGVYYSKTLERWQ